MTDIGENLDHILGTYAQKEQTQSSHNIQISGQMSSTVENRHRIHDCCLVVPHDSLEAAKLQAVAFWSIVLSKG